MGRSLHRPTIGRYAACERSGSRCAARDGHRRSCQSRSHQAVPRMEAADRGHLGGRRLHGSQHGRQPGFTERLGAIPVRKCDVGDGCPHRLRRLPGPPDWPILIPAGTPTGASPHPSPRRETRKDKRVQTVFVAGATGYLGRYICAEYDRRGWHVKALVRDVRRASDIPADTLIEAEATRPEMLTGVMDGVDVAVSALGITRQVDGLTYNDVDYQANVNLLDEAEKSGVARFGYVHVLNAGSMAGVPLVAAKARFVHRLQASTIPSTVIAPTGYFSDMDDFLKMARSGRAWLFGHGDHRINPIHGADLAAAIADGIAQERNTMNVGGTRHPLADRTGRTGLRCPRSTSTDHPSTRSSSPNPPGTTSKPHATTNPRPGLVLPHRHGNRHGRRATRNKAPSRLLPQASPVQWPNVGSCHCHRYCQRTAWILQDLIVFAALHS